MAKKLTLPPDFKELAELFLSKGVKFLIIGGYAVTAHGRPRYTGDIDFFVEKDAENAKRIVEALHEFFGPLPEIREENFLDDTRMSQFGREPLRIDILVSIKGVDFAGAWERRVSFHHSGIDLPFISLADLRVNKLATGRHKDLNDLEEHLPEA